MRGDSCEPSDGTLLPHLPYLWPQKVGPPSWPMVHSITARSAEESSARDDSRGKSRMAGFHRRAHGSEGMGRHLGTEPRSDSESREQLNARSQSPGAGPREGRSLKAPGGGEEGAPRPSSSSSQRGRAGGGGHGSHLLPLWRAHCAWGLSYSHPFRSTGLREVHRAHPQGVRAERAGVMQDSNALPQLW